MTTFSSDEDHKSPLSFKILIACGVIAVLGGIIILATNGSRIGARDNQRVKDLESLKGALEQYYKENLKYPYEGVGFRSDDGFCIEYVAEHPSTSKFAELVGKYMEKLPKDPRHNEEKCGLSGYALPDCYCYFYQTGGDNQHFKIWAKTEGKSFAAAQNDGGTEPTMIETYSITQGSSGIEFAGKWLNALSPTSWTRIKLPVENNSGNKVSKYQIMVKEADLLPLISNTAGVSAPIRFVDKEGNELFAWKNPNNNWWIKIGDQSLAEGEDWIFLYWQIGQVVPTSLICSSGGRCNSYDNVFEKSFAGGTYSLTSEFLMDDATGNNVTNTANDQGSGAYLGSSLKFDGVDDYVNVGSNEKDSPLAVQDKATYELWLYSREDKKAGIITQRYDGGDFLGRGIAIDSGKVKFWSRNNALEEQEVSVPYKLSSWNYVVGVQNGNVISLYLNGNFVKSYDMKSNITQQYLGEVTGNNYYSAHTIGKYTDAGYFFNGLIDEVRIYNQPLDAETIQKHYRGDYSSDPKDSLVMYQSFEEGPTCGNDVDGCLTDDSGRKNNATMHNFNDTSQYDSEDSPLSGWTILAPAFWQEPSETAPWDGEGDVHFRNNSALRFNGDGIVVSYQSYNSSQTLTLSAWIKPLATGSLKPIVGAGTSNNIDCAMVLQRNKLCFHDYSTTLSDRNYCSNDVIALNQWQFVALTFDNNVLKLYYNGVKVGETAILKQDTAGPIMIGGIGEAGPRQFIGFIDKVRVSNIALTKNEIGAQYYHSKCALPGDDCDIVNDPACRQACGVTVNIAKLVPK